MGQEPQVCDPGPVYHASCAASVINKGSQLANSVNEGLYVLGVNDVVRVSRKSAVIHERCSGRQEELQEVPSGTVRVQWGVECNIAFPEFNVQGVKVVESLITAPKWEKVELETDFHEQLINVNNIPDVVEIKAIPALATPPSIRWNQSVGKVCIWVWLAIISVVLIVTCLYRIHNRQPLPSCRRISSDDKSKVPGAENNFIFKPVHLVEYTEVQGITGATADDDNV